MTSNRLIAALFTMLLRSIGRQEKLLLPVLILCFLPVVSVAQSVTPLDTAHLDEMPVIELTYDASAFNVDTYVPAQFVFHSPDTVKVYACTVRHRGGTSLTYDKPNFALKFVDAEGEPKDVRFLGMRKDNNWILDAMASDYGKVRNRVSMDLWLAFSRAPYHQADEPKAVNGYRGRYVEVYANGEYEGLYCLSERLDRKQLKLKKFAPNADDSTQFHVRGLMYKATNSYNTRTPYFLWQKSEPDNAYAHYDGLECEYPNVEVGEPWDWFCLRSNIYFLAAKSYSTLTKGLGQYFDLPVFNDYVLFVDLLYAPDNVGKNFYCWYYDQSSADQRLGITPWDLDTSWGRNYIGASVSATSVLKNKSNYDTRCRSYFYGYADSLETRYAELRDSLWQEDSLMARFDEYFSLFRRSGAWERDSARWSSTNVHVRSLDLEQSFISRWIHDRLSFLDSTYHYVPSVSIREVPVDAIESVPHPDAVRFNLQGQPVDRRFRGFVISGGHLKRTL